MFNRVIIDEINLDKMRNCDNIYGYFNWFLTADCDAI